MIEKQNKLRKRVFFLVKILATIVSITSAMLFHVFIGIFAYLAVWGIFYSILFLMDDPKWN